jgi:hypothetical protein
MRDHRKATRKALHYPVAIEMGEGESARICMLSDVSDTGARLTLESPESVPDDFMMRLSHDGKTTRECHVVWRSGHQLGIQFKKEIPEPAPVKCKRISDFRRRG